MGKLKSEEWIRLV